MDQPHRNGILLMFDACCDITYVLKQLTVWNYLLHWLCTSELVLKQQVTFHMKAAPSLIRHKILSHGCDLYSISVSRKQGVPRLVNGVARRADLHDWSSDFHNAGSSAVWLVDWNEAEHHCVAATCLILLIL
jgi:hypothetical protein